MYGGNSGGYPPQQPTNPSGYYQPYDKDGGQQPQYPPQPQVGGSSYAPMGSGYGFGGGYAQQGSCYPPTSTQQSPYPTCLFLHNI